MKPMSFNPNYTFAKKFVKVIMLLGISALLFNGSCLDIILPKKKLTVEPRSLDFGASEISKSIFIRNSGSGEITWNASAQPDWIEVSPTTGSTTTETDEVIVKVYRDRVSSGDHVGTVIVSSKDEEKTISVKMSKKLDEIPIADFSANPTRGEIPLQVSFFEKSTGNVTSWEWDFGDGSTSNLQNPTHEYRIAGAYSIRLKISGPKGTDTETKNDYVIALEKILSVEPLLLDFGISEISKSISVRNSGSGEITWNVRAQQDWIEISPTTGSTTTETDKVIVRVNRDRVSPGDYFGTVIVSSGNEEKTISVKMSKQLEQAPIADFLANPTRGIIPLKVSFFDKSTGNITSWEWDFGDGSTSNLQNPTHEYKTAGNYSIKLMVSGPKGTGTVTKSDYIAALAEKALNVEPLLLDFGIAEISKSIFIRNSGSSEMAWNVSVQSSWIEVNQSAGSTTTETDEVIIKVNRDHVSPGDHFGTVLVSSKNEEKTVSVKVSKKLDETPVADFLANTTRGIIPLQISFFDKSTGNITSWEWHFGDGSTSNLQNPMHEYKTVGNYSVTLKTFGPKGTDTKTKVNYISTFEKSVNEAGYTAGKFAVNESGAATYEIPIVVPPGTAGMIPQISLVYNNRGKNGLLGVGWSLNGLSFIERCPTTIAQHGFIDGVDFDENDQFCLDNQLLVAAQGVYGAAGTIYRTENESFSKIVSYGQTSEGPESFKVWTKSGLILEYGGIFDSRIIAGGRTSVLAWAVNKIEDTKGNYLTVSYYNENYEFFPTQIEYTGNTRNGLQPYNIIEFDYDRRPDSTINYVGGSVTKFSIRLEAIRTYSDKKPVRKYYFEYELSPITHRTRLKSIFEQAGSTNLSKTVFNWQDGHNGFADMYRWEGSFSSSDSRSDHWVADVNGDGLSDLIYENPSLDRRKEYWVTLSVGTSFARTEQWGATSYNVEWYGGKVRWGQWNADVNGDGQTDIVYNREDTNEYWILLSNGTSFERESLWGSRESDVAFQGAAQWLVDVNGDGMTDIVYEDSYFVPTSRKNYWAMLSTGSSFASPRTWGVRNDSWNQTIEKQLSADVNADGLADIVYSRRNMPAGKYEYWVLLNNGVSFEPEIMWSSRDYKGIDPHKQWLADVNGDGFSDLIYEGETNLSREYWVMLNTGISFSEAKKWNEIPTTEIFDSYFLGDVDGDGKSDIILARFEENFRRRWIYSALLTKSKNEFPDLLSEIVNGHGAEIKISYKPLTDESVYSKLGDAIYPDRDFQGPLYVVSSYTSSNGIGSFSQWNYFYKGIKINLHGRGFSGFQKITVTDQQTGINTTTVYLQNHPFKTLISKVEERLKDGTLIHSVENTYEVQKYDKNWLVSSGYYSWEFLKYDAKKANPDQVYEMGLKSGLTPVMGLLAVKSSSVLLAEMKAPNISGITYFPYLKQSAEKNFEMNGSLAKTTINSLEFDNYGNPTRTVVDCGGGNVITTVNTYSNDPAKWRLGLLTKAEVSAQSSGQPTLIHTSSFAYDTTTGLLIKEEVEPGTLLSLTKTYKHDDYGNIIRSTINGTDVEPRSQSTEYDAKGRFATKSTNALGDSVTREYDLRFGSVSKLTDPNGLITTWLYDDFGREITEKRADGTQKTQLSQLCRGTDCPLRAHYLIRIDESGKPPVMIYYDKIDRPVRRETIGFDGRRIYIDTEYNARGQITRVSAPYFSNEQPVWTYYEYDDLGRLTSELFPNSSKNSITYQGLTTQLTNSFGQTSSSTVDSRGNLIKNKDALGNSTSYVYDSFGNLTKIIDPSGNTISMEYDLRGRKLLVKDPDMGAINYRYNALSEMISQKDAKNNEVKLTYDKLGRIVQREEPEGASSWIYDQKPKGIGKLSFVKGPNEYEEELNYDKLGRPSERIIRIQNQSYSMQTTYDQYGRVERIKYPTGLTAQNFYDDNGYLVQVSNYDTRYVYWKAGKINALGQIEQEVLGNGVITSRSFDANSGYIRTINTGMGNRSEVQNFEYSFDLLGNLKNRKDRNQNLTEAFDYDVLNRLTRAEVSGRTPQIVTYDGIGNIKFKSDLGNYTYGENNAGPHAVTSVSGSRQNLFKYDMTGNRIADSFSSITYTSFKRPYILTRGKSKVTFAYAPDRSYFQKITEREGVSDITIYLGGLYEKKSLPSLTKHLHYILGGSGIIAIHTKQSDNKEFIHYLHKDHLGSVTAITNETGNVLETLNFDAWGKRRTPDWRTIDSAISSSYSRGFTGHEQLDDVGLIHMNGRIYDPEIGRFLSPDPFIQAIDNNQALNSYSYVLNNPLALTDPSGFKFKGIGGLIGGLFSSIGSSAKAIGGLLTSNWKAVGVASLFPSGFLSYQVGNQIGKNWQTLGAIALSTGSLEWGSGLAIATIYEGLFNKPQGTFYNSLNRISSGVPVLGRYLGMNIRADIAYAITTGDWDGWSKAFATRAVFVASAVAAYYSSGLLAAPNAHPLLYVGVNAGIGFVSNYSVAKIEGASDQQALKSGIMGAAISAAFATASAGYQQFQDPYNPPFSALEAEGGPNVFGLSGPRVEEPTSETWAKWWMSNWHDIHGNVSQLEGDAFSRGMSTIPFMKSTAWIHDFWNAGNTGPGYSTMVPAFLWSVGSVLGDIGGSVFVGALFTK